jgi:hypothetical protein
MVRQFEPLGIAAAVAGVTESQVRYWVRKGLLPTRTQGFRERPLLVEVAMVRHLAAEQDAPVR